MRRVYRFLVAFSAAFAARFSSLDFAGFFFVSFLRSIPFDMCCSSRVVTRRTAPPVQGAV
jgi:hypothetical protein